MIARQKLLLFTIALLLVVLPISVSADSVPSVEKHQVLYGLGKRSGSISDYDATSEYIFFAYAEQGAVVDAYDFEGNYAFSLSFESRERGSISLRCYKDLLYVNTKKGNVLVFDGTCLVDQYDIDASRANGYTDQWFNDKRRNISAEGLALYRLDEAGVRREKIAVPRSIVWQIHQNILPFYIVAIVFVIHLIKTMFNQRKKGRHRPEFYD